MSLAGVALTRAIVVAAVLLAMLFVQQGVYSVAAVFVVSLAVYGYLLRYGDEPIERRL
jgi:O-antigen/teichoic acid export membrane protein